MNIEIDDEKLVELLKDLVKIDSVNPSLVPGAAGETEIAEYVREWMVAQGLKPKLIEVEPGRPNVIGVLKGTGGGKSLFCIWGNRWFCDCVSLFSLKVPIL